LLLLLLLEPSGWLARFIVAATASSKPIDRLTGEEAVRFLPLLVLLRRAWWLKRDSRHHSHGG
jgi:hypothetical protein